MGKHVYTLPVAVEAVREFWRNTLDKGMFSKFTPQSTIALQIQFSVTICVFDGAWNHYNINFCKMKTLFFFRDPGPVYHKVDKFWLFG